MIPMTLNSILTHLKRKGFDPKLQDETNQLYMNLKIGEKEFPMFIRIYENTPMLQILTFIPCTIKPEAKGDLARLLHLLNAELDYPGFGMDENKGVVFYREMLVSGNKNLDEAVFDSFLNAAQTACKAFSPPVEAVAYGAVTLDDIIKKIAEKAEKAVPENPGN